MARSRSPRGLTNLELEVMRPLWDAHPAELTVREVAEAINAERPAALAYTTVQTMLKILKEKGVVSVRSGESRAHTYAATVSRDDVRSTMVGDLVLRLYDGSARPLLQNLLGHESMQRAELEDLRRMIDEHLGRGKEGSDS